MRHLLSFVTATGVFAAICAYSPPAAAGLDACGNIHIEASAECELLVEGGCVAQCEPVRFEAACAADLYAECRGSCDELPSVECQADCQASCMGNCEVDPGMFECSAACQADCMGECDAACASGDSECRASCEGACSARCDASCEGTPPEASCEGKCEASCSGRCEASANLDCQVDCQAQGFAQCQAELQGGCEAACERPEGALFCDGQYIDHGGNLDACVDALRARFDIEVEGYAEGMCEGGVCEGEAGGSISCAVDPIGRNAPIWGGFGAATVVLLIAARRRRTF